MTTGERLLDVSEVSAILGVPVATLRWWLHTGDAPDHFKVGRHVRFRHDDVDLWLEARRRPGGSAA